MVSSARLWLPKIGLGLLSLLVALSAAEWACRGLEDDDLRAFFTAFEHDDSAYSTRVRGRQAADGTGLTLNWYVPGASGVTGSVPVKINNLGLRDERDYPEVSPQDCFRVLVLGDSMTFGKGVREVESWPAILEQRLSSSHPGRCIEVLNSGIPNTNFHIQWLHFLERWRGLQPDLVLVGFFVYNDSQLQDDHELYFPAWMATVDGSPALKRSALIRLAYYRAFTRIGQQLVDQRVPRYFEEDYRGWRQFRRSLADLQLVGLLDGFQTVVSLIPIPVGYDEYPFTELHDRMRAFLEHERGIPVADLMDGLSGVVASDHWVHPSDGHPDPALHRLIGEHLAADPRWIGWLSASVDAAPTAGAPISGHRRLARAEGAGWASGQFVAGQRSGPWLVVTPAVGTEQPGRVEWGSYDGGQRGGLWTIRTSTWQDEGWQIFEEVGSFEQGARAASWRSSTRFMAHSSLEMDLGEALPHAGPWRSEDQVSDSEEGRAEGEYTAGHPTGRWSSWEPQAGGSERLVSMECLSLAGELLWEWARGDAASIDDEESMDQEASMNAAAPAARESGVLTPFELATAPLGAESLSDSGALAAPDAADLEPKPLSADAVKIEPCPPT